MTRFPLVCAGRLCLASACLGGWGRPPGESALLVWSDGFGALVDRRGPLFLRFEPRRQAVGLMLGLLSGLDCKNCWTIAERRGAATSNKLQHLLSRARWDAAACDVLWTYVLEVFADPGAVLAVDETGDLKKGDQSVGVPRQYTGTAGRIENSQVAVLLTSAARRGPALLDRALYLPRCWIDQPDRRAGVGVSDDVRFASKPALAAALLERAVAAGVPARWVAADEVYGADPELRRAIRRTGLGYVLQIGANRWVPPPAGRGRADRLPGRLAARAWQRRSAGTGSKADRRYSWAWIELSPNPADAGRHYLLVRRHDRTSELAYLHCYSPQPATLGELIRVAGQRWRRRSRPGRQRTHRAGPAPSPPVDVLAPANDPRDARARLPRRHRRGRTGRHPGPRRPPQADHRRAAPPVRRPPATHPARHQRYWPGPPGDDDTKPGHRPATTEHAKHNSNDLRL